MKRTGFKRKKGKKKDNSKDKELAAHYGAEMKYWRYKGLKGIYWHFLSIFIRKRDFHKYGTCISCGKEFRDWRDSQAGHYAPAGNCGFALLFDPRNINAECASCNNPRFSPGKLIPYRANLVRRYGEKHVKKLDDEYAKKKITKEWTKLEYDKEIRKLIGQIKKIPV